MRSAVSSIAVAVVLFASLCNPAAAGGWQGGDHSILRDGFAEGFTLTRLWSRLDRR